MSIIEACILGVVQGATEFLPVSSSGHLVIIHQWFGDVGAETLGFDVALHVGTLLAVVIYFWKDIARLVSSLWTPAASVDRRLIWILAIATVPAILAGYFLESTIDRVFHSTTSVGIMLILIALAMWAVEHWSKPTRPLTSISWVDGILIGLAQAVALIPGTSRSGSTIITGMVRGLGRASAARFSFLLAIPAILGAAIKKSFDLMDMTWTSAELATWGVGILTAAITGWIAIRWLLAFLQTKRLYPFIWYRLALGLALLLFF